MAEAHARGTGQPPVLLSLYEQAPGRGGPPQKPPSKDYQVYGSKKAREEAVRNGGPPVYTRTVQASTVTFRCTRCGAETQTIRYPGPKSLYCDRYVVVVRREQTQARAKKSRHNQRVRQAAEEHAG